MTSAGGDLRKPSARLSRAWSRYVLGAVSLGVDAAHFWRLSVARDGRVYVDTGGELSPLGGTVAEAVDALERNALARSA